VYRRQFESVAERVASDRPWRTAVLAVAGLLVAIAIIGVAGILINRNIHQTVERAINFDVELEDRGDDLRVAILEVRHFHRDLLLDSRDPSPQRIEAWRERYAILLDEIAQLDLLLEDSPPDPDLPEIGVLRGMAEEYYAAFDAALRSGENDAQFFDTATSLLEPLDAMANIAERVDDEGDRLSGLALIEIDDASATGTIILGAVIIGLGAMGGALAFAVLRLVQDQRRLMAVEQAAAAQMAEASRAKTDFIADASHELRTPLTVLRGNAEVGLAIQDDCAHAEILGEIVDESVRMSRLVDDLLFLARSDASRVPLELREIDSDEFIDGLVRRAQVLARERGASLITDVSGDGPLMADPDRVEQAVLILIDNAAKYGPAGGSVDLAARADDGWLIVEVSDRGPGIPGEQLSRVFERFYRMNGVGQDRTSSGAGLGLSIAAAIVEGHGGRIAAEHRQGGGTTMSLRLPLLVSAAMSPEPAR
jgi:two-component system, OmpR family, sensor histidine kinase VicK